MNELRQFVQDHGAMILLVMAAALAVVFVGFLLGLPLLDWLKDRRAGHNRLGSSGKHPH